jgi:hypothetical protein
VAGIGVDHQFTVGRAGLDRPGSRSPPSGRSRFGDQPRLADSGKVSWLLQASAMNSLELREVGPDRDCLVEVVGAFLQPRQECLAGRRPLIVRVKNRDCLVACKVARRRTVSRCESLVTFLIYPARSSFVSGTSSRSASVLSIVTHAVDRSRPSVEIAFPKNGPATLRHEISGRVAPARRASTRPIRFPRRRHANRINGLITDGTRLCTGEHVSWCTGVTTSEP